VRGAWRISLTLPPVLAIALAGCVSGLSSHQTIAQRYILLAGESPENAAAAAGEAAGAATARPLTAGESLRVLRPEAAPGLEGHGIAVLRPGARLDEYRDARWAADTPEALQRLIVDALRRAGRFAVVESDTGPFSAQYLLSLELQHFEARYDSAEGPPTIEVALVATLGRRSDGSVVASIPVSSRVRAAADRMQAVIDAFQSATRSALSQLAEAIAPPPAR
jgi:ABC-type uncharacterized transport system auxiliary subunit